MFVVFRTAAVPKGTFTVFETFPAAVEHAEFVVGEDAEPAEIYEVSISADVPPGKRVPAAAAAVKMDEGTRTRTVVPKATPAEIERANPLPDRSARGRTKLRIEFPDADEGF